MADATTDRDVRAGHLRAYKLGLLGGQRIGYVQYADVFRPLKYCKRLLIV